MCSKSLKSRELFIFQAFGKRSDSIQVISFRKVLLIIDGFRNRLTVVAYSKITHCCPIIEQVRHLSLKFDSTIHIHFYVMHGDMCSFFECQGPHIKMRKCLLIGKQILHYFCMIENSI